MQGSTKANKTQVNIYSTRQFRFVQLSRYSRGFTSSYPKLLSNSVDIWFCLVEQISGFCLVEQISGFCLVEQISNIVQLSRYLGTVQFSMYYLGNHRCPAADNLFPELRPKSLNRSPSKQSQPHLNSVFQIWVYKAILFIPISVTPILVTLISVFQFWLF